jgi:hypothetical protein
MSEEQAAPAIDVTKWENIAPAGSLAVSLGTCLGNVSDVRDGVLYWRSWVAWDNGNVLTIDWPPGERPLIVEGDTIRAVYQRAVRG